MTGWRDSWLAKESLQVQTLQGMNTKVNIKIPVEITGDVQGSVDIALCKINRIVRVYRI